MGGVTLHCTYKLRKPSKFNLRAVTVVFYKKNWGGGGGGGACPQKDVCFSEKVFPHRQKIPYERNPDHNFILTIVHNLIWPNKSTRLSSPWYWHEYTNSLQVVLKDRSQIGTSEQEDTCYDDTVFTPVSPDEVSSCIILC